MKYLLKGLSHGYRYFFKGKTKMYYVRGLAQGYYNEGYFLSNREKFLSRN